MGTSLPKAGLICLNCIEIVAGPCQRADMPPRLERQELRHTSTSCFATVIAMRVAIAFTSRSDLRRLTPFLTVLGRTRAQW